MTIHSEHPFLPPEDERNPIRRLRGRLISPVTVWTAYDSPGPVGLTVSSMLVADGAPGRILGLLDPDSDLFEAVHRSGLVAVSVLSWEHRHLADAFAGVAPAPGGPFRMAQWLDTEWGPVLAPAVAWAGCRLDDQPRQLGWGMFVQAAVDRVELGDDAQPLGYRRGRYLSC